MSVEQRKICEYIDFLRKENSFDKVELKPIFGFMEGYK